MASRGRDSIRLSTYDELFSNSRSAERKKVTFTDSRNHRRRSAGSEKRSELLTVLQKQRVLVDENAIHFVAEARSGKRADARNSVFKLAKRYEVLPDREHVQQIKYLYGKVKENEDSGDEAWDKSVAQLPGRLDIKAVMSISQGQDTGETLLVAMDEMKRESEQLGEDGDVVTQEPVAKEATEIDAGLLCQESISECGSPSSPVDIKDEKDEDSCSEEEVELDEEAMQLANSMQREFLGNNLVSWYKDIQKAYETGVKLVKVNRLGYKFIRIVSIKDMLLSIRQPHTKSQAKLDRSVALHSIVGVRLGKGSLEFNALDELVTSGKEPVDFKEEDNRNGFVFYMRVLMKKAKAAAKQLADEGLAARS